MEFEEFRNPIKEARQGRTQQKRGVATDMNAMVDIAFLLLTFFLLTTTMVRPKALELVMPVPESEDNQQALQTIKESRALNIVPLPGGKLAYYQGLSKSQAFITEYGSKGIKNVVQQFLQQTQAPIVLIKPHPESDFENLIDILDVLNLTHVERYTIDRFTETDSAILARSAIYPTSL